MSGCIAFFQALDDAVADAGVADAQAAGVPGFPYLRVNRFLSHYRPVTTDDTRFQAWVDRLVALAREGRRVEWRNLPTARRLRVAASLPGLSDAELGFEAAFDRCSQRLRTVQLATPAGRLALQRQAQVPSDYRTGQRVVGLYAVTALPVAFGIYQWHERTLAKFQMGREALWMNGQLTAYNPPGGEKLLSKAQVADILRRAGDNPLGIPEPNQADVKRLFATFAPVWELDVVTDDDRLGAPYWPAHTDHPEVDIEKLRVFQHLSYTLFQGKPLLQLNYVIWFSSRPCTSVFDILCGQMDGINWRVTLSPEGEPLIYDSMHNCGCYHQFFPTRRLVVRTPPNTLDESAFVPAHAPDIGPGQRLVLRIASRTHHIEAI
ncbi:MAG: hypothetical protein MI754_13955, partial [Chromatiales bacterium]|nr:hypothetical protein [Chromatiales bacterium]